jgi:hypothetical protein|tara:strand:- start:1275 stop:1580 length:306 start_codon:yes stop_codon:yes gene_type:complete
MADTKQYNVTPVEDEIGSKKQYYVTVELEGSVTFHDIPVNESDADDAMTAGLDIAYDRVAHELCLSEWLDFGEVKVFERVATRFWDEDKDKEEEDKLCDQS